ncbi:PQQ-dependent sugar dehydrogenase [Larkinella arboricola]
MKFLNWFILIAITVVCTSERPRPFRFREQASAQNAPDSSRFSHMMLVQGLDEPTEMAILPNNNVLIVERKGGVRLYDAQSKELKTIAHFNVFSGIEDGLLGVALDPDFKNNNWAYFYYAVGGEEWVNHLARYELRGDQLIQSSKKVLLEVPTQRKYCCHSAGYLTFDSDGLLYLSIGDNTNAEEIEGHNPTDERPGRELSDDQASTANSNDLRGKILRIKPEADGTYSIPDGNLFPKDGSKGRPEIYVMGCRNPFRMSVDPKTKYVYWGDVGPDTQVPAEEGFLSYDEINQARKPGFFGYPYFLGNNEAFPKYDFATKKEGPPQDPRHPVNNSPHNTGIRELPPAQPAMIWYGKQASKRFPLVGKGGASAMAGPVYYRDQFAGAKYRLPEYYNGKLFIYDWIRRWIMAVTLDENGNYQSMEPFLSHLKLVAPMDIQFNRDGAMYILAYGTNWFAKNTDAGLIRVEYTEGNRNPIADIRVDKRYGATPLKVRLSAAGSRDHDPGDKLSYAWQISARNQPSARQSGPELVHTFTKPGVYNVALTVSDQHGGQGSTTVQVKVGNTPPVVQINTTANRSFYWDNQQLDYRITIKDPEDGKIDPAQTSVSFNYLPYGNDLAGALSGGSAAGMQHIRGEKLFSGSDCKACHALDKTSIGPSLKAIAARYGNKTGVVDQLAGKIIKGGSGNWGSYQMTAHPDLPLNEAQEMVRYILALNEQQARLPMQGTLKLTEHVGKGPEGAYVLVASYKDKGANGIEPLSTSEHIVLRNPLLQTEDNDGSNVGVVIATANTGFVSYVRGITNGKYMKFNHIDLTQVTQMTYRVQPQPAGGRIELHLDSPQGPIVSTATVPGQSVKDPKTDWNNVTATVQPTTGFHDLYFVFTNTDAGHRELFFIDWLSFGHNASRQ